jgi:hypothetical protein
MDPIPLPPTIPLAPKFEIPGPALGMPEPLLPKWETVPVYKEDVPALAETKETKSSKKKKEKEKEKEKESEEPKGINREGLLDEIGGMITPMPSIPPWEPQQTESIIETVEVPFTNFEVPVPPKEILVTAVTTAGTAAVVSVGATMAAGKVFEQVTKVAKPIIKFVLKKLASIRGKEPAPTWGRARLKESHRSKRGKKVRKDGS